MFSHIMIGANDIARSKTFYDAVIGALGGNPGVLNAMGRLVYAHRGGRLLVTTPINGQPASGANGGTIGFAVESPEEADAWHKAGVKKRRNDGRGPARCAGKRLGSFVHGLPSGPGRQQVSGAPPDTGVTSIGEERRLGQRPKHLGRSSALR